MTQHKLSEALDECLTRIRKGEPVRNCLAEYPHLQKELVPLLHTAVSIEAAPKVSPSDKFRRVSRSRLLARLLEEPAKTAELYEETTIFDRLGVIGRIFEIAPVQLLKVAVPLVLALMIFTAGFSYLGLNSIISPSPESESYCTLATLSGSVQWQGEGSGNWEKAEDGMTLEEGSWVRTATNSQAVLTFSNGSAVKLDPSTVLMVEQIEYGSNDQSPVIVMNQWLGRTSSSVEKLADHKTHYEIQTPSATAVVCGTIFNTEVDEIGATTVQTIEGLVSVGAQGEEVYVAAGKQTSVTPGAAPSIPVVSGLTEGAVPVITEVVSEQPPAEATIIEPEPDVEATEPQVVAEQDLSAGEGAVVTEDEAAAEGGIALSWQGEYNQWLILAVLGSILFSFGMIMIFRRKT